jgi:hypothetical protein
MLSVPKCYNQGKLGVSELLEFSCCELLLWKAGSCGMGIVENPEEGERPMLEAAAKQQLVKPVTGWKDLVCPLLICEVGTTVRFLLVVTIVKISINSNTNPNPVYIHSLSCNNMFFIE